MSTPTDKNFRIGRISCVSHAFKSPYRSPLIQNQRVHEEDSDEKDVPITTKHHQELIPEASENTPATIIKSGCFTLQNSALKRKFTPDTSVVKHKSSFKTPFKSPLMSAGCSSNTFSKQSSETTPKRRCIPRRINICSFASPTVKKHDDAEPSLAELILKEKQLDEEISSMQNDGYDVKELQTHIDKLHYYNDLKDLAQMVMGRLAQLEGTSLRAIHERYDAADLD